MLSYMSLDALVHALVQVLVYALVDVTGETGQERAAKSVQETKLTAYPIVLRNVLVGKASMRVKQIRRDLICSRSYCSATYKFLYSLVQSHPIR